MLKDPVHFVKHLLFKVTVFCTSVAENEDWSLNNVTDTVGNIQMNVRTITSLGLEIWRSLSPLRQPK